MKLKILEPGKYNDTRHQADHYEAGAELETTYPYGLSLIEAGLAEEILSETEVEKEEELQAKAPAPKRSSGKGKDKDNPNPFVPPA